VVDDDTANRQFLTTLLGYQGYQLLEASSGGEALVIARTEHPDLIISDVLMPAMDGYEFVRQLRAGDAARQIRVIFYTATYYEREARMLAESGGVARVLTKPSDPEVIVDAVRDVLGLNGTAKSIPVTAEYERDHKRLLTDTLFEKVAELKAANASLLASETRYRTFFDSNPLPMWILDAQTLAFLAVNESAIRHYGYSREEFLGMTILDIRPPEDATAVRAQMLLKDDEFIRKSAPWTHRTKDGTLLQVAIFSQAAIFEGRSVRVVLAEDITERQRSEERLRESEQQLRELAGRLQSVREEERLRVARQLHDELGQALTALKMNCAWITARLPEAPKGVLDKLQSSIELVDETIVTVRRLSAELRPGILDLGLSAAIEWQAAEFQSRSDIECTVELIGEEEMLDTARATEIFRVFQETLTNVARHANATQVKVILSQKFDEVSLEVRDNGRGIVEEEINDRHALGILGMRERVALLGGSFSIQGRPDCGTTVQVVVPVIRQILPNHPIAD